MDFSDDQLAIIGCFAAIAVCGLIAAVTFHFGSAGKASQGANTNRSLAFPKTTNVDSQTQDRKAA